MVKVSTGLIVSALLLLGQPAYASDSKAAPDSSGCSGPALATDQFVSSLNALVKHWDLKDIPFIEKELQVKLVANPAKAPKGYALYDANSVLHSSLKMLLMVNTSKKPPLHTDTPNELGYDWHPDATISFFADAGIASKCIGITVSDMLRVRGNSEMSEEPAGAFLGAFYPTGHNPYNSETNLSLIYFSDHDHDSSERRYVRMITLAHSYNDVAANSAVTPKLNYAFHTFELGTPGVADGSIELLDYRYGQSHIVGTRPDPYQRQAGHIAQTSFVQGQMPVAEYLDVKWRVLSTDKVYEDRVDLKNRLPSDIAGKIVHAEIKGPQLSVYLIEGNDPAHLRSSSAPACPLSSYQAYKCTELYPKHWNNF